MTAYVLCSLIDEAYHVNTHTHTHTKVALEGFKIFAFLMFLLVIHITLQFQINLTNHSQRPAKMEA